MSAGVARQYTGTAGRVENCQVGVFLAYVTPDGSRALIDRELYLPEKWTGDGGGAGRGDRRRGRVRDEAAAARQMIERAVRAGVRSRWVPATRSTAQPEAPHVAGRAGDPVRDGRRVQRDDRRPAGAARGRAGRPGPAGRVAAAELRRRLQGAALYDWALIGTAARSATCWSAGPGPGREGRPGAGLFPLLVAAPGHPARTGAVAGARWGIEIASARRRTRPAWTTTRSAGTAPGTGTSPCPCSRTHSSRHRPRRQARGAATGDGPCTRERQRPR